MNKTADIIEMAFEPGKTDKFIHPDRKERYEEGSEELNAILPDLSKEEQSYLEKVTSDTYQKMVSRLENYLGLDADDISIPSAFSLMFQAVGKISEAEKGNIEKLEQMAISTVLSLDEFSMVKEAYDSDQLDFDVEIGQPELKKPDTDPKDGLSEAETLNLEFAKELEDVSKSKLQRRLANLLIQGGAMQKMYLFKLVSSEINKIDPDLMKMYETLAVTAQMGYWTFPPDTEIDDATAESAAAGSENVQPEGGTYIIKARAICFPYLIHELTKGIYEWIALNSDQQKAMEQDTLSDEPEDTTVGVGVYQELRDMVENEKIFPLVMKKFVALDPKDSKAVLAKSEEGKEILAQIIQEAEEDWEAYQAEEEPDEEEWSEPEEKEWSE